MQSFSWRAFLCLSLMLSVFTLAGCGDDDDSVTVPEPVNDEEVITTVTLTFTPEGGGVPVTAESRDADGPGGDEPVIIEPNLAANTTYAVTINLLNETVDMSDEDYFIINEIREEAEEHQIFFYGDAIESMLLTHTYADTEASCENGNAVGDDLPVGLVNTIVTGDAGSGTFSVRLSHLPPVNDMPVKVAGIDRTVGEADFDIMFNVNVQ